MCLKHVFLLTLCTTSVTTLWMTSSMKYLSKYTHTLYTHTLHQWLMAMLHVEVRLCSDKLHVVIPHFSLLHPFKQSFLQITVIPLKRAHSPSFSHSARQLLSLFLTLPMDSGGTGCMCWSRLADGESAALTAPSQWSFSPFRSSWDSSWRKVSLSSSQSSDQNCRTWGCPALSNLCFSCSKESIVCLGNEAKAEYRCTYQRCGPGQAVGDGAVW